MVKVMKTLISNKIMINSSKIMIHSEITSDQWLTRIPTSKIYSDQINSKIKMMINSD